VVIPLEIRKELGLDTGTQVVVAQLDDFVVLKKIAVPDLKKEFEKLTLWGAKYAEKKGIRNEEDVARLIHEARGISRGKKSCS